LIGLKNDRQKQKARDQKLIYTCSQEHQ
jgi:hypothetical protein